MSFSCKDLSEQFQARMQGPTDRFLSDVAPLDEATEAHLSFAESKRQVAAVRQSAVCVILQPERGPIALPP